MQIASPLTNDNFKIAEAKRKNVELKLDQLSLAKWLKCEPVKKFKFSYFKILFPEICLTGTLLMHPIPSRDTTVQDLIESLTSFGI